MFTALVVWLMLKWEDQADEPHAARWLILIAYLMGLSIGIHILNLLTVPALVYIYYFRKYATVTFKGFCIASVIALAILWFINGLIIPYTVYIGRWSTYCSSIRSACRSILGHHPFALSLFALPPGERWYTHRRGRVVWNTLLLATTMILLGYSSYAMVTIAAANPPMNSNDPSNPHALFSVLNRDQYGGRLLYGAYYSALVESVVESTRYCIDDEGRYATAFPTGYTHPQQFSTSSPHVELRQEPSTNTNSGQPTAPKVESAARRAGQRPARRKEDAARRGARLRHGSAPTTTAWRRASYRADPFWRIASLLLPAQLHVLALFPVELRRPPERHPARRFDDDHRRQLAVGESTRSTASTWGRRRICRAKWLTTKRATPTISYPSSWASSG